VFWYRTAWGGNSIELTKLYPAVLPQYIMIQRVGNLFSAGVSTDGVHFTLIPGSTATVSLGSAPLAGLAATLSLSRLLLGSDDYMNCFYAVCFLPFLLPAIWLGRYALQDLWEVSASRNKRQNRTAGATRGRL